MENLGSYSIYKLTVRLLFAIALSFLLLSPVMVMASPGPANDHLSAPVNYTTAITLPYTFAPITYTEGTDIGISLNDPAFISQAGSIGLTLVQLVSTKAFLSVVTLIFLGLMTIIWLFALMINKKVDTEIKEVDLNVDLYNSLEDITRRDYESKMSSGGMPNAQREGFINNLRDRITSQNSRRKELQSQYVKDANKQAWQFKKVAGSFYGRGKGDFNGRIDGDFHDKKSKKRNKFP